jgi:hypothetical protein
MANTGSRLVELQLLAAQGKGGNAAIMEADRLADGTLPDDDRMRIEAALSGILGEAASVSEEYLAKDGHRSPTIEMPGHDPRNPEHVRFHREWTEYHESERHFIADNPGADARLRGARLPQSVVTFAIKNRNPQILFFLSHPKNRQFANELAQLPAHDLQAELEQLAAILLNDDRVPIDERGIIRRGSLPVDTYLKSRHGASEMRKPLSRSREDMDVDDFLRLRKDERKSYRRIRGHR